MQKSYLYTLDERSSAMLVPGFSTLDETSSTDPAASFFTKTIIVYRDEDGALSYTFDAGTSDILRIKANLTRNLKKYCGIEDQLTFDAVKKEHPMLLPFMVRVIDPTVPLGKKPPIFIALFGATEESEDQIVYELLDGFMIKREPTQGYSLSAVGIAHMQENSFSIVVEEEADDGGSKVTTLLSFDWLHDVVQYFPYCKLEIKSQQIRNEEMDWSKEGGFYDSMGDYCTVSGTPLLNRLISPNALTEKIGYCNEEIAKKIAQLSDLQKQLSAVLQAKQESDYLDWLKTAVKIFVSTDPVLTAEEKKVVDYVEYLLTWPTVTAEQLHDYAEKYLKPIIEKSD